MGNDKNWEDVGAAWDDIADAEEDGDGIKWADDADGPAYLIGRRHGEGEMSSHSYLDEVGPMGELPTFLEEARRRANVVDEDSETVMGHDSPERRVVFTAVAAGGQAEPIDVPDIPADIGSTKSTSSSDGSPVEKLEAALEKMKVDRGRNRAQTPVQGNERLSEIDWLVSHPFIPSASVHLSDNTSLGTNRSSVLLPDEQNLFASRVEERAMRRRASRLIPIAVSPLKPKIRQLIITNHRLVCVKQRDRGVLSVKCELVFRLAVSGVNGTGSCSTNVGGGVSGTGTGKEKAADKDSRTFVIDVESKTDKEFVVLTVCTVIPTFRVQFLIITSVHRPASPRLTQPTTWTLLPPGSTKLDLSSNHTSPRLKLSPSPSPHGHDASPKQMMFYGQQANKLIPNINQ